MDDPIPFEQEYPEEAAIMGAIVARNYSVQVAYTSKRMAKQLNLGRNDTCPCERLEGMKIAYATITKGGKFKKCCLPVPDPTFIHQKHLDKEPIKMGLAAALLAASAFAYRRS